jgi:hypothetical protein
MDAPFGLPTVVDHAFLQAHCLYPAGEITNELKNAEIQNRPHTGLWTPAFKGMTYP